MFQSFLTLSPAFQAKLEESTGGGEASGRRRGRKGKDGVSASLSSSRSITPPLSATSASAEAAPKELPTVVDNTALMRSPSGISLASDDAATAVAEKVFAYKVACRDVGADGVIPEEEYWTLTELLTLAQAVSKVGDADWHSVSKAMRTSLPAALQAFHRGTGARAPLRADGSTFFAAKKCEQAWMQLKGLEEAAASTKKMRQRKQSKGVTTPRPSVAAMKTAERLRVARCVQIRKEMREMNKVIAEMEAEIPKITSGELDHKLDEMAKQLPEVEARKKKKTQISRRESAAATPKKISVQVSAPPSVAPTPRASRQVSASSPPATPGPQDASTPAPPTSRRGRKRKKSDADVDDDDDEGPRRRLRVPTTPTAEKKVGETTTGEVQREKKGVRERRASNVGEKPAADATPQKLAVIKEETAAVVRSRSASPVDPTNVKKGKDKAGANSSSGGISVHAGILNIVNEISAHENAYPFRRPVQKKDAPDYDKVVKKKMDLGTLKGLVVRKKIQSLDQLRSLINLVFDNAMLYNKKKSLIYQFAAELKKLAGDKIAELESALQQRS